MSAGCVCCCWRQGQWDELGDGSFGKKSLWSFGVREEREMASGVLLQSWGCCYCCCSFTELCLHSFQEILLFVNECFLACKYVNPVYALCMRVQNRRLDSLN